VQLAELSSADFLGHFLAGPFQLPLLPGQVNDNIVQVVHRVKRRIKNLWGSLYKTSAQSRIKLTPPICQKKKNIGTTATEEPSPKATSFIDSPLIIDEYCYRADSDCNIRFPV